jgi:hypothetical protein
VLLCCGRKHKRTAAACTDNSLLRCRRHTESIILLASTATSSVPVVEQLLHSVTQLLLIVIYCLNDRWLHKQSGHVMQEYYLIYTMMIVSSLIAAINHLGLAQQCPHSHSHRAQSVEKLLLLLLVLLLLLKAEELR